ncbi:MAG: transketolase [Pseudomonadota bacterium]|jgi:transketolase
MFVERVKNKETQLKTVARAVRCLGMDAVLKAKSGHVGLPLGGADVGTFLYFAAMNHSPQNPKWLNRDRFVLSAGHGSMLQYALLHLSGYDVSLADIQNFRQWGSKTPGHPEFGHTEGIEVTTGPLGQGIANAVGMALAESMMAARINSGAQKPVDHSTYVLLGDGCLMEGISSEACSLAGHLKLDKLIAFYDANNITIDGTIDITFTENVAKRFEAFGWRVLNADSHSFTSLAAALDTARSENSNAPKPTLVVCTGVAGKGSPKWEGKPKIHGNPMTAEDVIEAKKHLGLTNLEPFAVEPEAYKAAADCLAAFALPNFETWNKQTENILADWRTSNPAALERWNAHTNPVYNVDAADELWDALGTKMATRVASGKALTRLAEFNPTLVGGSADLAGSNNTTLPNTSFVQPGEYAGRNIHFGVREHAMAAIANGLALHGGFRPYCATFAVFSDYMRPSIRLAALMKIPTVFVLTHDSYAVGEDGPTHQPVEHAASLRCIPNLEVLRPADARETLMAWELALSHQNAPTALLLTRQDLPCLDDHLKQPRSPQTVAEGIRTGAYLLKDFDSPTHAQKLILVASGSEVAATLKAALWLQEQKFETLAGEGVQLNVRVVSCPAPQKLACDPIALARLVPEGIPAVAVEAGSPQGWAEIVGRSGAVLAMRDFGASAPADVLTQKFGFTAESISERCLNHLHLRPRAL